MVTCSIVQDKLNSGLLQINNYNKADIVFGKLETGF